MNKSNTLGAIFALFFLLSCARAPAAECHSEDLEPVQDTPFVPCRKAFKQSSRASERRIKAGTIPNPYEDTIIVMTPAERAVAAANGQTYAISGCCGSVVESGIGQCPSVSDLNCSLVEQAAKIGEVQQLQKAWNNLANASLESVNVTFAGGCHRSAEPLFGNLFSNIVMLLWMGLSELIPRYYAESLCVLISFTHLFCALISERF